MVTYYQVQNDRAQFKCYECGRSGWADREVFVKITGLFGARHRACVEDIDIMEQIPPPSGAFDPRE